MSGNVEKWIKGNSVYTRKDLRELGYRTKIDRSFSDGERLQIVKADDKRGFDSLKSVFLRKKWCRKGQAEA